MHKRLYSKLYVNKNREEGSEKIYLGYQNNTTEYPLPKDRETYFHIPPYTEPVVLADSSLIIDGALGGSFPAVSDRIFESRRNYGNTSNHGSPSEIPDGTWFCSWLYRNPSTGISKWYDRYFDPKKFNFDLARPETFNGSDYILNAPPVFQASGNDVIYDVPSTTVLEPTVLYKYFHIGEKTAESILTTFGGVSGEHILLDIRDWPSYKTGSYPIEITSGASPIDLFPDPVSSQVVLSSGLGFKHNHDVNAYINWNQNYIPSHDFTLGVWCESGNWDLCPSTQIVGNYSAKGGFGIFVDTLKTYPFFVIPETKYGHLIFLNQKSQGFLDKVVTSQLSAQTLKIPELITLDSNDCVYVCSDGDTPSLYKMDHGGNILAKRNISLSADEVPISLMWDPIADNITLTTTKSIRKYSQLITPISQTTKVLNLSSGYAASAFSYNSTLGTYSLSTVANALDLTFIEDTSWSILNDNNIYKNGQMFLSASGGATNLQVDPNGNLWVLHGNNNVSVFDPTVEEPFQPPLFSFTVGTDIYRSEKHLSFINTYDRTTLTDEWRSVIYYKDSRYIYTNTLDGKISNIVDISPFVNYKVARQLGQDPYKFLYGSKGDFTGYETKRVFNSLNPHKQIVVKAALRDKSSSGYLYKTFKCSAPIEDWDYNIWKHIILTHKNRTLTLYVNGIKQTSFEYSGQYELSFEQQPSLFFGSPLGVNNGLNKELGSVTCLFNGTIGDVKFYDYSIDPTNFEIFLRAGIAAEDILWSLPIPSVSYVEQIERMYKNKLPGSKSSFYNIKLSGTNIKDPTTRSLIEEQIKKNVAEVSPMHADLVKVTWIG